MASKMRFEVKITLVFFRLVHLIILNLHIFNDPSFILAVSIMVVEAESYGCGLCLPGGHSD